VNYPTALSADGSTYAYGLSNESNSAYSMMVNENPGPEFKRVGRPVLSRDGACVAYKATKDGVEWFVLSNGRQEGPAFEDVTDPAVSADGRVVAFAGEADPPTLFVGERRVPIERLPLRIFLSRDGSAWGLVGKNTVTTAEGRSESFDEIRGGEFSPGGDKALFAGRRGEKWFVIAGGKRFDAPGLISEPVWNKDGSRVGFGALLGQELWWKVISTN